MPSQAEVRAALAGKRPHKKTLTSAVVDGKCVPETGIRKVAGVARRMPYVPSGATAKLKLPSGQTATVERCRLSRHKIDVGSAGGCALYAQDDSWKQGPQYRDAGRYCAKVRRLRAGTDEEPVGECWTTVNGRRQRGRLVTVHGATVCRHYRWKPPGPAPRRAASPPPRRTPSPAPRRQTPARAPTPGRAPSPAPRRQTPARARTPTDEELTELLNYFDVEGLVRTATPAPEVVRQVGQQLVPDSAPAAERRAALGIAAVAAALPEPPTGLAAAVSAGRRSLAGNPPEIRTASLSASAKSALNPSPSSVAALESTLERMKSVAGASSPVGRLVSGAMKRLGEIEAASVDRQADAYLEALGSITPVLNVVERAATAGTVPIGSPKGKEPEEAVVVSRERASKPAELLGFLARCRPELGLAEPSRVLKSRPTSGSRSDTAIFTATVSKPTEKQLARWAANGSELLVKAGAAKTFPKVAAGFGAEIAAYGVVDKLIRDKVSPHFFRSFGDWQCTVRPGGQVPAVLAAVAKAEAMAYPKHVKEHGHSFRFLALELGKGSDLDGASTFVDKLGPASRAAVAFEVLWTLDAMHDAGLQHNDLHRGNIFLDRAPGPVVHTYVLDAEHAFRVRIPAGAFVRVFDLDWSQSYGPHGLVPKNGDNPNITPYTCRRYNICKQPPNRYADAMRAAHTLRSADLLTPAAYGTLVRPAFEKAHSSLGRLCRNPNPKDRDNETCGPFKPGRTDDVLLPAAGIVALSGAGMPFANFRIPIDKVDGSTPVFLSAKARSNRALVGKLRAAGADV